MPESPRSPAEISRTISLEEAYAAAKQVVRAAGWFFMSAHAEIFPPPRFEEELAAFDQAIRPLLAATRSPQLLKAVRAGNRDRQHAPEYILLRSASWLELCGLIGRDRYSVLRFPLPYSEPPESWPSLDIEHIRSKWGPTRQNLFAFGVVEPALLSAELTLEMHRAMPLYEAPMGRDRDQGWSFFHGGYRFRGREISLRGKQLQLLQTLAEAEGPVSASRLLDRAWLEGDAPTQGALQSHLSFLRTHLRDQWCLGNGDPIPCVDRGTGLGWRFDHQLFKDLKAG